MSFLLPSVVQEALDNMDQGDASAEVLTILVTAARSYAQMAVEYGFESPMPGLSYSTRNEMLIETMKAGKPGAPILYRVAPDWKEVPA